MICAPFNQPDYCLKLRATCGDGKPESVTGTSKENNMATILIGFSIIMLVGMIISAILALAACMRSSQISQQQEEWDKQKQWDRLYEISKQETINDIENLR